MCQNRIVDRKKGRRIDCASRLCASRPTLVSAAFNENYDVTTSARCSAAQRGASGVEARTAALLGLARDMGGTRRTAAQRGPSVCEAARTTALLGLGGTRAAASVGSIAPYCACTLVASMLASH